MRQEFTDKRFNELARTHPAGLESVLLSYSSRHLELRNRLYDFYTKQWIKKYLQPTKADTVLDFGCGWGRLSRFLAHKVRFIEGADRSKEMILQAEKHTARIPNVHFTQIGNAALPFSDLQFNKVFTCFVLQLLEDDDMENILNELFRIIQQGGRVVMIEHVQMQGELQTVNIVRRQPIVYEEIGKNAGFNLVKSIPALRMPSYSMDAFEKLPLSFNGWLSLLMWIEKITVNRKPETADHFAYLFIFEKPQG